MEIFKAVEVIMYYFFAGIGIAYLIVSLYRWISVIKGNAFDRKEELRNCLLKMKLDIDHIRHIVSEIKCHVQMQHRFNLKNEEFYKDLAIEFYTLQESTMNAIKKLNNAKS